MMTKLKAFLWVVVIAYLLYALVQNGPSIPIIAILVAAVVVGMMQLWLHSDARKRLYEKYHKEDQ